MDTNDPATEEVRTNAPGEAFIKAEGRVLEEDVLLRPMR
jgi:hypothetical protein